MKTLTISLLRVFLYALTGLIISSCMCSKYNNNMDLSGLVETLKSDPDSLNVIYRLNGSCSACIADFIQFKISFDKLNIGNMLFVECEDAFVPNLEYYLSVRDLSVNIIKQSCPFPFGDKANINISVVKNKTGLSIKDFSYSGNVLRGM